MAVSAPGLQTTAINDLVPEVGRSLEQNFHLQVASATEVVEITGTAPVVESSSVSVGSVIDQRTVQEIPLNGRHFHVLPNSFQRIRHYGLLGNRHRAEHLARCRELLAMPVSIPEPRRDYRERLQQLGGNDPLLCPQCKSGKMVRIAILPVDSTVQRCDSS